MTMSAIRRSRPINNGDILLCAAIVALALPPPIHLTLGGLLFHADRRRLRPCRAGPRRPARDR